MLKTTDRELATILAALMLWRDRDEIYTHGKAETLEDSIIKDCNQTALDGGEIDDLIEKLNASGDPKDVILFYHKTDGGAEYLTDCHAFANAKVVIRIDGGPELVCCEVSK